MKRFRDGFWYFSASEFGFRYIPPGEYDDAATIKIPEGSIFISFDMAEALIPELEKAQLIKPKLEDRVRAEDLKITHRLLDLLEHKLPSGN